MPEKLIERSVKMVKVNRFKVKINDNELMQEIKNCVEILHKLNAIPYIKTVAKNIGLKEYELQKIIVDLDIHVFTGRKTYKLIISQDILTGKKRKEKVL